jgi:hypothetical protein
MHPAELAGIAVATSLLLAMIFGVVALVLMLFAR